MPSSVATSRMLGAILPSRQLDEAARLAVYQDAYRARLGEFLANDYPVLASVLGDDDFVSLASAYIGSTPSLHRNARWYGQQLPDFLRAEAPWCDMRALADLAAFEHALGDAFDAADAPCLDAGALAAIAGQDQPRLSFALSPSLALLTLLAGTTACYEAVIEGAAADMPDSIDEETILIWRDASLEPLYRPLEEDEALALAAAKSGATLAEICGLLSLRHEAEAAAGKAGLFLARWFADGLVTGLVLPLTSSTKGIMSATMSRSFAIGAGDVLLVVDLQNDFCPGRRACRAAR